MRTVAQDMALIPTARHCDSDGNPVFTLAELAEQLGVIAEEADTAYRKMLVERRALGLPVNGAQIVRGIHARH